MLNPRTVFPRLWTPAEIDTDGWYDAADPEVVRAIQSELGVLDLTAAPINPHTGKPWQVGDKYRLMFSSSTLRDAQSSDIADYNSHVQAAATAAGLGTGWKAVGSTSAIDADENTDTEVGVDVDSAIIMLDGATVIAVSLEEFWNGSRDNIQSNIADENGLFNQDYVTTGSWAAWEPNWTGTNGSGSAQNPLGGSTVNLGLCSAAAGAAQWVSRAGDTNVTEQKRIYGMSPVLTIAAISGGETNRVWDKSGKEQHLDQPTGANRPHTGIRTLNGLNVLDFDGGDFLAKSSFPIDTSGDHAVLAVVDIDSIDDVADSLWSADGTYSYQLDAANASQFDGEIDTDVATNVALAGGPYSGPQLMGVVFDWNDAGQVSARVNGAVSGTPQTYDTNKLAVVQLLRIFADRNGADFPNGAMAEVVVLTDVSLATIQLVEGYLAWKWGLQGQLDASHPYKEAAPVIGTRDWTPADAATPLHAWYDTDDASTISDTGGKVDQIDDKSGNGNHATNSGTLRPTTGTRTIGGKNVFDYNGAANEHLDFASVDFIGKECWAVINIDSLAADFTVCGGANNQNTVLTSGLMRIWGSQWCYQPRDVKADQTLSTGTDYILGFLNHKTSQKKFSVDGVLTDDAGIYRTGNTLNMYAIADNQYAHATDGMIGEVVIFDGELSPSDRARMEGYMAHKWGQASKLPSSHPYKTFAPQVG